MLDELQRNRNSCSDEIDSARVLQFHTGSGADPSKAGCLLCLMVALVTQTVARGRTRWEPSTASRMLRVAIKVSDTFSKKLSGQIRLRRTAAEERKSIGLSRNFTIHFHASGPGRETGDFSHEAKARSLLWLLSRSQWVPPGGAPLRRPTSTQ